MVWTGLGTPMLDFFRRGEVARDIRMLAAQGAIAPRPLEQLGILMVLTSDSDAEIRETAEQTLKTPAGESARRLHRARRCPDRDARVLHQARHPAGGDAGARYRRAADRHRRDRPDLEGTTREKTKTFQQRLANMTVPEKVKCASKGTREMRAILIRDPNRMVAAAVLSCPKVNDAEVEAFAKMGNVSEEILRTIAMSAPGPRTTACCWRW